MKITLEQIKKLRNFTGAGVMDCRRALEESGGDWEKAKQWLRKKGAEIAQNKADKTTKAGIVEAYIHTDGRLGALVKIVCETDFVARGEVFKKLAKELAMQVAAMAPANINDLLEQEYIRDPKIKIKDLVAEAVGKVKENVKIEQIVRIEI